MKGYDLFHTGTMALPVTVSEIRSEAATREIWNRCITNAIVKTGECVVVGKGASSVDL